MNKGKKHAKPPPNSLNTHALVTTTLRDELVNCANICAADHGDYLKDLPERDKTLIACIKKKSNKGAEPWYPLTRRYLGKLVYNVQISKALNKKVEEARIKMSDEELQLFEEKENEELASRYGDRIVKVTPRLGGLSQSWIERYARVYDLEIVRQMVVIHHSMYGYREIGGVRTDCSTSMLFMVRRRATEPPVFIAESTPLFGSLGMQPLDTLAYHYLPDDLRALDPSGQQWRGGLERSHTFLACFVHLYCRPGGVCLELGCGTAPILKTCMNTGRVCASIDVDMFLMTTYVEPLLLAYMQQGSHDDTSRSQADDEVDPRVGFNPYD